jgi:ribonuclease BN (tRNA processing enzyme)
VKIILLGTGGYHPSEQRHTACLLVPEWGLMFDAGTATFRVAPRLATRELDIFLTHAHLDHIVGLTYLLAPLVLKEVDAVRVHAAPAVLEAVRTHLFADPVFPVLPEFDFQPLEGSSFPLRDGVVIRWQPLASHPGASMAYRVDWAREDGSPGSMAYVTDTTVDGSYGEFIRGVDLLIHECYFADDASGWAAKTGHSHTGQVLSLAREAGVKKLVLTHVDPRQTCDDPVSLATFRHLFPNTVIATDGMEIELSTASERSESDGRGDVDD